jgi:hypothetical protein
MTNFKRTSFFHKNLFPENSKTKESSLGPKFNADYEISKDISRKKDNIDFSDYIDNGDNIDTNGQQSLKQKNFEL